MSPSLGFLLFLSAIVAAKVKEDCSKHKCPAINILYQELKCTPVGPGCCPKRFDCSSLELRRPHHCYLGTNYYKSGETVPDKVVKSSCSAGCYCSESGNLYCANIECPEYLGNAPPDDCLLQYRLGGCCIHSYVCDEDEIAKLATCELDGKVYKEGELMETEALPCSECICSPEFNGNLEAPFCRPHYCGYDLHYTDEVRNYCAPMYYGQISCCPIGWICDKTDKIKISGFQNKTDDPEMVCKYRDIKLNLGASFMAQDEKCTTCSCDVPPFVHCIKDPKCYTQQ